MITLLDTDAHEITETLAEVDNVGSPGQVMTLVIDTDDDDYEHAIGEAKTAGKLHPSRVVVAVRTPEGEDRLDVRIESTATTELISLMCSGAVAEHADSVILPLLLPELPVVLWYPRPGSDELLRTLTGRVIVDSARADDPAATIVGLARSHSTGTTDLAWARLTRWRALLVAALDQVASNLVAATVCANEGNASAVAMEAWLAARGDLEVMRSVADGFGLNAVSLATESGDITLTRISEKEARLELPGQPGRTVALTRRTIQGMLAEEFTRLTGDVVLDEVMAQIARSHS